MKKIVVRKVAEIGTVPLYLSVLLLSGSRPDYNGVVDEVASKKELFWGVLLSNALCLVLLRAALSSLLG